MPAAAGTDTTTVAPYISMKEKDMHRRHFLKVAGLTCLGGLSAPVFSAARFRPNIIFILLDDLGYFNFTCYGGKSVKGEPFHTPHVDALAREGMQLTNCHSRAMCAPTRRVLMTGKGLYDINCCNTPPASTHWISQYMKKAGYRTGIAGKWMLGRLNPRQRGFDEACIWAGHYDYWKPKIMLFNSGGYLKGMNQPEGIDIAHTCFKVPVGGRAGQATVMQGRYGPDLINDFACDFVARHSRQPFFLYCPMKLIHAPYEEMPGTGKAGSGSRYIEYADKLIQKVVTAVDKAGIRDNTLIMLTSDNGFSWQHQVEVRDGVQKFPGSKGSALEGSTRVPFIARWPGRIEAGTTYEGLVDFADMLPTLVQLVGGKLPEKERWAGRSFLPQLLGDKGRPREWIYIHGGGHPNPLEKEMGQFYVRGDMMRYVRGRRYKLYGDGRFYDMTNDIWEQNNIPLGSGSLEAEERRRLMQSVLNRFAQDVQKNEPTHAPRVDVPPIDLSTLPSPINTGCKLP